MPLDAVDLRILPALHQDSSLNNVALANPKVLGLGLDAFISISLKEQAKEALAEFECRIAEHDELMACYLMRGDSDYLIRVAVADIGALKQVRYKTALPLPV